MAWKCPRCEEELSYLDYNVDTSGSERGTAELNQSDGAIRPEDGNIIDDYSYDDSEQDWSGDPKFECPHCNESVLKRDLIWFTPEEKEEEKIIEKVLVQEEEEHDIVTPSQRIQTNDQLRSTSSSFICCNKDCFKVFVAESKDDFNPGEFFVECPQCGTINSSQTYRKLLEAGYYNKPEHVNTRRKKQTRARPNSVMGRKSRNTNVCSKIQRLIRRKKTKISKKN